MYHILSMRTIITMNHIYESQLEMNLTQTLYNYKLKIVLWAARKSYVL